jgi:ELWxxDGT repeat protein
MRTLIGLVVAAMATALFVVPAAAAAPNVEVGLVSDIRPVGGSDPRELTHVGRVVFFSAADGTRGRELWVSDGTDAGTHLVRDINPGAAGSKPALLTRVGTRLFFTAQDGRHGRELWVSDGTRVGTRLVKDLTRGAKGTAISGITDGAGTAYFGRGYRGLWRTDGTARGTQRIRDFSGVDVANAKWLGSRLFLSADDALWKTDGSTKGTVRLSPTFWGLDGITRYRGRVYFRATPPLGAFGGLPQLWWSDGTKAGTRRLGTMQNPTDLMVKGGTLYFDAQASASKTPRLYRTDGSAKGTVPVSPRVRPLWEMANRAGRLWGVSATVGQEYAWDGLWVSDGSAADTTRVAGGTADWWVVDWWAGGHAGLDDRLWFAASPVATIGGETQAIDVEPWSSDGTTGGTTEAADIHADGSSYPRGFVKLGGTVLFSANDGVHGRELWAQKTR